MPFEDLEKANQEIDRLKAFEPQVKELTDTLVSLTSERDKALEDLTNFDARLQEANKGGETLQEQLKEKDASIEALQSQINQKDEEITKIQSEYVSKADLDSLQTQFIDTLKNQLKGYNVADNLIEGKSISELKAMNQALAAVKTTGTMTPKGLGLGSDGNPTRGTNQTQIEREAALIAKQKGE